MLHIMWLESLARNEDSSLSGPSSCFVSLNFGAERRGSCMVLSLSLTDLVKVVKLYSYFSNFTKGSDKLECLSLEKHSNVV